MIKEFENYGYLITDIDENLLINVKNEIKKNQMISISDEVDGHVSGTYSLKDSLSDLENIVMPYLIEYDKHYNYIKTNYSTLTDNLSIVMNDAGVSFQNKHEFNPAHRHPGLMSFIIWLDIPYTRDDEIKLSPGKSKRNKSGSFTMYYTNSIGDIETKDILLDESYNNKMLLIPSKIKHSVSPFYSTEKTRVSVAGNFFFETKENKHA